MASEPVYDTNADVEFGEGVNPSEWRDLPEPTNHDEDDDEPVDEFPTEVIHSIGFDPSDIFDLDEE